MTSETTRTDVLHWAEPPTRHKHRRKPNQIERTFAKLKSRPGEWARVMVRPESGGVAYLSQGLRATGKVVVTQRTLPNGATGLWAKYTG